MSTTLATCPFCGDSDIVVQDACFDAFSNGWKQCSCNNCEATSQSAEDEAGAVLLWNRREGSVFLNHDLGSYCHEVARQTASYLASIFKWTTYELEKAQAVFETDLCGVALKAKAYRGFADDLCEALIHTVSAIRNCDYSSAEGLHHLNRFADEAAHHIRAYKDAQP